MPKLFKKKPKFTLNPYFKFFASVRFAIPALFAWAAAMIYGTFAESIYGTSYVRNAVYHTWWFYLIQGSIAASIVLSVIDRIPFRKKLLGFYLVHGSFVVLMIGAVVTRYFGVDGNVDLHPGAAASTIRLPENVLFVSNGTEQVSAVLPEVARPARLGGEMPLSDGTIVQPLRYLPFAGTKKIWKNAPGAWSSTWLVKSPQFEQKIELIDQPGAPPAAELGPLRVEVVPPEYYEIIQKASGLKGYGHFLYNVASKRLEPIPEFSGEYRFKKDVVAAPGVLSRSSHGGSGTVVYRLKVGEKTLNFFPSFSPLPVNEQLNVDTTSDYRLLALDGIGARSTVLLSRYAGQGQGGNDLIRVAFGKTSSWNFADYKGEPIALPWMGLQMQLLSEKKDAIQEGVLDAVPASKDEQQNMQAALVRVSKNGRSEEQWVTDRNEARFEVLPAQAFLGNKEIPLPFTMELERFKMDQVPGTDRPASYESFVKVRGDGPEKTVHIYMNHPFKANGYTFYQSSYFQDEQGQYHSILSVNKDPGRPIKYAGSLLLVIAMTVHFLIIYGHIRFKDEVEA